MKRKEATRSSVVGERKELKRRCERDRIKREKCEKSKIKMLVRMIGRGALKDRDTWGGRGEPIVGVRLETRGGDRKSGVERQMQLYRVGGEKRQIHSGGGGVKRTDTAGGG